MKINKDIRKSNTLDGDFYSSNEMFEIVRKNIFDRSWQFVCSSEELSQNNSAYQFYFIDEYLGFYNERENNITSRSYNNKIINLLKILRRNKKNVSKLHYYYKFLRILINKEWFK